MKKLAAIAALAGVLAAAPIGAPKAHAFSWQAFGIGAAAGVLTVGILLGMRMGVGVQAGPGAGQQ